MFHLNVEALRNMMRPQAGNDSERMYVLAVDGRVLLSIEEEDDATDAETLSSMAAGARSGSVELEGETYYYYW
jgi:hypothetical protein